MAFLKCLKTAAIKILKITEGATKYYTLTTNSTCSLQDGPDYVQVNVASGGVFYVNSIDVTGYSKLRLKVNSITYSGGKLVLLNNNEQSQTIALNTPTDISIALTGLSGTITLQLAFNLSPEAFKIYEMYLTNE